MTRPLRSSRYPWYDSEWLARYETAKAIVARVRPGAISTFVDAFRALHTRPDFSARRFERIFDDGAMNEIRRAIDRLRPADLVVTEGGTFGRFLVRNHPLFTALQRRAIPLVEEAAGERVEASYNFLSLYTGRGICPVHMDAPDAKWTLDLCVQQSQPWPLYVSQVRPWPDASGIWPESRWADALKESPDHQFSAFTMAAGEALLFSGSSQWHYRNAMPGAGSERFCDLLFFHFVAADTAELVSPKNWARLFGIPELDGI